MTNTVVAQVNNNPLLIDQFGSYVNLIRKDSEEITAYRDRVIRGYKDLYELDNESFYRSLGYITKKQERHICRIDIDGEDKKACAVKINSEYTEIIVSGTTHKFLHSEYKFLVDLITAINLIPGLALEELQNNLEWHFLQSKNLIKVDNTKLLLQQFVEDYVVELPRENVTDFDFWREQEFNIVIDDDALIREERNVKSGYFEYKDFPVLLTWTPFSVISCNELEFKNTIKDSDGNLTQKGAKVINKILEKQNTYWGE